MMTSEEFLAYEIGVRGRFDNITDDGWEVVQNALLKQVPVYPDEGIYCPICGEKLTAHKPDYCAYCGQAIKYE